MITSDPAKKIIAFENSVRMPDKNRILQLDGLRGIAVLIVICFHYLNNQYIYTGADRLNSIERLLMRVTSLGWSGVNLFFILSGFLIGTILLKNRGSESFFKTFYIRRFFRIVPAYYILLLVFFIFKMVLNYGQEAILFEKHIPLYFYFSFLQNFAMSYRGNFGPDALTPTWSLAVEEQFYLIIPLIIYYIRPRYMYLVIVSFLLIAIITRYFATNWYAQYTLLPSRIDNPVTGFLLAFLYSKESFRNYISENISKIRIFSILLILLFAGIYFFTPIGFLNHTILGFMYALLVLMVIETQHGIIYKFLTSKILIQVGKYSYFMYLFHQIINGVFHLYFLKQNKPLLIDGRSYLWTILAFITTTLLAIISYKLVENPLIKYSHTFQYKRKNVHESRQV